MGKPENDYAVWATLNDEDVPVLCSRKKANAWLWSNNATGGSKKTMSLAGRTTQQIGGKIAQPGVDQ
jgi:hypothetical protein